MKVLRCLLLLAAMTGLACGNTLPDLSGNFHIELERGILRGDLCFSSEAVPDPPNFLLNKGLNIVRIYNSQNPTLLYQGEHSSAGGEMVGEGNHYLVTAEPEQLENGFCVEYVGAYPVYMTIPKAFDFKGIIAFNGKTLRASEQTKWYPIPYEPESGKQTTHLSFDIELACDGCQALYMNGDRPVRASSHRFRSELPRPLLIYAGAFEFQEMGGIYYLGSTIKPENARELKRQIDSIAEYFSGILKLPLEDLPQLLSFQQVRERSGWAFISWPTIAFDGKRSFDSLFSEGDVETGFLRTLSHEMGHYYFATLAQPVGTLYWFYLESTTEFLSALFIRDVLGGDSFKDYLQNLKMRATRVENPRGLHEISDPEEISNDYRYSLAPLWMLALEHQVGTEPVREMLREFLSLGPKSKWDYHLFREAARAAGIDPQVLSRFESKCMTTVEGNVCLAELLQD